MSKFKDPKVRFFSLSSLQTSRGGFLLAESALFTLLSLLNFADSGTLQLAIAFFFFSLSRFSTLLTFVFRSFFAKERVSRMPRAKEQRRRHAGSVLASRTARARQHLICQVREARALRRDQQASLLITAISILSDGTSASLGRSTRRRRIKKHGFSAQHRRQDSSAPWRWRPTAEIAKHQILSLYANLCTIGTRAKALSPSKGFRRGFQASSTTAKVHRGGDAAVALIVRRRSTPSPPSTSSRIRARGCRGGVIRYVIVEDSGSLSRIFVVLS